MDDGVGIGGAGWLDGWEGGADGDPNWGVLGGNCELVDCWGDGVEWAWGDDDETGLDDGGGDCIWVLVPVGGLEALAAGVLAGDADAPCI